MTKVRKAVSQIFTGKNNDSAVVKAKGCPTEQQLGTFGQISLRHLENSNVEGNYRSLKFKEYKEYRASCGNATKRMKQKEFKHYKVFWMFGELQVDVPLEYRLNLLENRLITRTNKMPLVKRSISSKKFFAMLHRSGLSFRDVENCSKEKYPNVYSFLRSEAYNKKITKNPALYQQWEQFEKHTAVGNTIERIKKEGNGNILVYRAFSDFSTEIFGEDALHSLAIKDYVELLSSWNKVRCGRKERRIIMSHIQSLVIYLKLKGINRDILFSFLKNETNYNTLLDMYPKNKLSKCSSKNINKLIENCLNKSWFKECLKTYDRQLDNLSPIERIDRLGQLIERTNMDSSREQEKKPEFIHFADFMYKKIGELLEVEKDKLCSDSQDSEILFDPESQLTPEISKALQSKSLASRLRENRLDSISLVSKSDSDLGLTDKKDALNFIIKTIGELEGRKSGEASESEEDRKSVGLESEEEKKSVGSESEEERKSVGSESEEEKKSVGFELKEERTPKIIELPAEQPQTSQDAVFEARSISNADSELDRTFKKRAGLEKTRVEPEIIEMRFKRANTEPEAVETRTKIAELNFEKAQPNKKIKTRQMSGDLDFEIELRQKINSKKCQDKERAVILTSAVVESKDEIPIVGNNTVAIGEADGNNVTNMVSRNSWLPITQKQRIPQQGSFLRSPNCNIASLNQEMSARFSQVITRAPKESKKNDVLTSIKRVLHSLVYQLWKKNYIDDNFLVNAVKSNQGNVAIKGHGNGEHLWGLSRLDENEKADIFCRLLEAQHLPSAQADSVKTRQGVSTIQDTINRMKMLLKSICAADEALNFDISDENYDELKSEVRNYLETLFTKNSKNNKEVESLVSFMTEMCTNTQNLGNTVSTGKVNA